MTIDEATEEKRTERTIDELNFEEEGLETKMIEIENFLETINKAEWRLEDIRCGNEHWKLVLKPFISAAGCVYLSVQLLFDQRPIVESYVAKSVRLGLFVCIEHEEDLRKSHSRRKMFTVEPDRSVGWQRFVRMDEISKEHSPFLDENGTLTLQLGIVPTEIIDENDVKRANVFDTVDNSIAFIVGESKTFYYTKREIFKKYCPAFEEALGTETRGIKVSSHSESAVELFLQVLNQSYAVLTLNNWKTVWDVATYFGSDEIKRIARTYLNSPRTEGVRLNNLRMATAERLLQMGDKYY